MLESPSFSFLGCGFLVRLGTLDCVGRDVLCRRHQCLQKATFFFFFLWCGVSIFGLQLVFWALFCCISLVFSCLLVIKLYHYPKK